MPKTSHDLVVEAKQAIREVSPEDARRLIQGGAVVLDVREPEEFAAGHLPGALHIPRGMLEFRLAGIPELNDPRRTIVVYCKTSGRAALATVVLQRMGVSHAVSLAGGFDAWAASGLPVDLPAPIDFE
ncbi:rhodanese-like domain-containing protein [Denitromonas iodatirespirans]|uniref:Sulfurtransferase n=1 Tax=Denitromonas iodatirespirans TaxID=2795389 RepID=A0A944DEC1_DENI1|nr:rhodanese-like domain-containing protein [Denitromonas iodatirespirans]MBT0961248.1 sulfurtransferase [Denitromonas iodatirespirans]